LEKFKTRTEEIWSMRSRDIRIRNYQIYDAIAFAQYYDVSFYKFAAIKKR